MSDQAESHVEGEVEGATDQPKGTVLIFCTDLMFTVQLQSMARKANLRPVTLRPGSGAPLPEGDLLVVDMAARADWESVIREAASRGVKVVAFGPHVDADARRKAK